MAKPDFSMDEVIAQIKKYLPVEEGAFCRGDLVKTLGIPSREGSHLLARLRDDGLIEPAGKVRRADAWGNQGWRPAYRLVESNEIE